MTTKDKIQFARKIAEEMREHRYTHTEMYFISGVNLGRLIALLTEVEQEVK